MSNQIETITILDVNDVAKQLKTTVDDVAELIRSGILPTFSLSVSGEIRTSQQAVNEMVQNLLKRPIGEIKPETVLHNKDNSPSVQNISLELPSLEEIRSIQKIEVKHPKFINQYPHSEYNININGENITITIVIFPPEGNRYKGESWPYWGAEVYLGKIGHGMRPVNEWIRASDYETSKRIASVIRKGKQKRFAKVGESIDKEYAQLDIDEYRNALQREKNIPKSQCVVCTEDDHGPMVLHALIRCRLNGWL
jgi:hypothetical protein